MYSKSFLVIADTPGLQAGSHKALSLSLSPSSLVLYQAFEPTHSSLLPSCVLPSGHTFKAHSFSVLPCSQSNFMENAGDRNWLGLHLAGLQGRGGGVCAGSFF